MKTTPLYREVQTEIDLYKAIPAQVVEIDSSSTETVSEIRKNSTSASDDSDTLKIQCDSDAIPEGATIVQRENDTGDVVEAKEKPCLAFNKSEDNGNNTTLIRGSTPVAFKFLQPKRKLLEPNQILTADEEEPKTAPNAMEKPVIEEEIVKALPSVKALARAFLMTTNTTQPEKLWLRKARTLSHGGKKRSTSPMRSLDQIMQSERIKAEDDITITSELSSLETDSSSVVTEIATTLELTPPTASSTDSHAPTTVANTSPVPVIEGVFKSNIAFFENLKNK